MKKNEILKLINDISGNNENINKLLQPNICFKLSSRQTDGKRNYSKIGGAPFFYDIIWPELNNKPLNFLAQISLDQISEINNILPKKGVLYFFVFTDDIGYRFPDRKGEFKVKYIESPNVDFFSEKENTMSLNELFMDFCESYSFPSYQESIIEKNNVTDNELEIIDDIENEILYSLENDYDIQHQIVGHPKAIQGTVRFWWALKYLRIEEKNFYTDEEIKLIKEEEDSFVLLLQLNFGDPKIEFDYFGDSIAYFGIHRKDLQNNNFENVILVIQNT